MENNYESYLIFLCESYCSNKLITTKQWKQNLHSSKRQIRKVQAALLKEGYISVHSSGLLKVNYRGWEQFVKERKGSIAEEFFYAASLGEQYSIDVTTLSSSEFKIV